MHFQNSLHSFCSGKVRLTIQNLSHLSTHCSWKLSSFLSHGSCGVCWHEHTHWWVWAMLLTRSCYLLCCLYQPGQHGAPGTRNKRVRACENYRFSANWDTSWALRSKIWRCWEPWSSQRKGDSWGLWLQV